MKRELAEHIRDQLAIETHEIVHLLLQINERLQTMSKVLEAKPSLPVVTEEPPLNVNRADIINALWDSNADRPREDIEAAVNTLFGRERPNLEDDQDMDPTYSPREPKVNW